MTKIRRRDFFKKGAAASLAGAGLAIPAAAETDNAASRDDGVMRAGQHERTFNGPYHGPFLNRVAFPMGGIGAGMMCLEGTGCISHVSVRNAPDVFNEPFMFAAVAVKGQENGARVLEGPVPPHKIFGSPNTGNGARHHTYGFPRFRAATFQSRFPFAEVKLEDDNIPLQVSVTGWSPFIPTDAENSGLPVAGLEYTFRNTSGRDVDAVFSYHSYNFMQIELPSDHGGKYLAGGSIQRVKGGFILSQKCLPKKPEYEGHCALFTTAPDVVVDYKLFRGGWFDTRSIMWKDVAAANMPGDDVAEGTPGASLYIPLKLKAGEERTIPILFAWFVPHSNIRRGPNDAKVESSIKECEGGDDCCSAEYTSLFYEPWYSSKFHDVHAVADYWRGNYDSLRRKSELFSSAFYSQSLPDEVIEAVAANLTILKSPTVLRQKDGRTWAWEGCHDAKGCCSGSCTHVWNYAQAMPHLFPSLERSLRETEFRESQDDRGHQTFRTAIPIRKTGHGYHAASDGQLGGIMKMYREWRISGDTEWLRGLWPLVKKSMDYCIQQWDPAGKGVLEEPHHNTYDIEFWGPEGMCTSFYLGALQAMVSMGKALGEKVSRYEDLLRKGRAYLENELFDGEYFYQKITWEGLQTPSPLAQATDGESGNYSEEALELLKKEGPKYQYGVGCLSDGILGAWMASMCGLGDIADRAKVRSHLVSVHKYNLKKDLSNHANPQRPGYAYGSEGGLLLCSWPKGGMLSLPFVYSNEVWTGVEYQVASHLMLMGEVEKGLDVVRTLRKRYDGQVRNPFNEYECGHWYARAMSSYGMIQGLTGVRYDRIEKALYIDPSIGDTFRSFLSTETGFGLVGLEEGRPFVQVVHGEIAVDRCLVRGKKAAFDLIRKNS